MIRGFFAASLVALAVIVSLPAAASDKAAVVDTYTRIAHAMYEDSSIRGKALQSAVDALIAKPGAETMAAAREAWRAARVPYQQTEAYRFGNPVVDDWEGKVNAWPLDEGLIDYVAGSYGKANEDNALYTANVVANTSLQIGTEKVDASRITKALLQENLHEAGGVEANVATGYHAIEFLLWGQDLNGTGKGAGDRPWTDYSTSGCTNGNCARRAEYLKTVTSLLIDDLEWMVAQWAPGGEATKQIKSESAETAIARMLTGLGSLSYGELAGERMQLGLLLHDPEEEHDCFSDNTHNSHFYDQAGMQAVYLGSYTRIDGSVVKGPALADLVEAKAPAVHAEMTARLDTTTAAMQAIKSRAEAGEAYDQMIGKGNAEGNAVVQAAIDALKGQAKAISKAVAALGLKPIDFEGSDSLDSPGKVFE